jgi:hypothetical protein
MESVKHAGQSMRLTAVASVCVTAVPAAEAMWMLAQIDAGILWGQLNQKI